MYAIKGQIILNNKQKQQVYQRAGNNRFVWNQMLDMPKKEIKDKTVYIN